MRWRLGRDDPKYLRGHCIGGSSHRRAVARLSLDPRFARSRGEQFAGCFAGRLPQAFAGPGRTGGEPAPRHATQYPATPHSLVPTIAFRSQQMQSGGLVRYGWLRVLLVKAQEKDKATGKPKAKPAAGEQSDEGALPPPPTTTELLKAAETRLAEDLTQTNSATIPATDHAQQRETMKQVLAGREFRNLYEPTVKNTLLEKLGNWLNKLFERRRAVPSTLRVGGFRDLLGIYSGRLPGAGVGLAAIGTALADAAFAGERQFIHWSRLGARVAIVAQGCAQCRRCGPMARGDSFPLLGGDLASRIEAAVARRPRPHSARVSCAGCAAGPAPRRFGHADRQL